MRIINYAKCLIMQQNCADDSEPTVYPISPKILQMLISNILYWLNLEKDIIQSLREIMEF